MTRGWLKRKVESALRPSVGRRAGDLHRAFREIFEAVEKIERRVEELEEATKKPRR